jgi:aminoglycoside/choline kinase family phosphotransferase
MKVREEKPCPKAADSAEEFLRAQSQEVEAVTWKRLSGDGSDRTIYRCQGGDSSVVVIMNKVESPQKDLPNENDSFHYIAGHLREKGIETPEIYHYDRDGGWFLLEDLGDLLFQRAILDVKEKSDLVRRRYLPLLGVLCQIQVEGKEGFDLKRTHNRPYDSRFMREWESGYFCRFFLERYSNLKYRKEALSHELDELAREATEASQTVFLYRDFQSRNILIQGDRYRFVDFQGGRLGPPQYDIASLLIDPYVDLTEALREEFIDAYLAELGSRAPVLRNRFLKEYPFVAIHRNMQILGAFSFLSLVKGKTYFERFIPSAVRSLKASLGKEAFAPYRELKKIVSGIVVK